MNRLYSNRQKWSILAAFALGAAPFAKADFDSSTFVTTLTTGIAAAATLAAAVAAVKAGVMVWGKVAKYFSKAG